jgi:hypothetical protein
LGLRSIASVNGENYQFVPDADVPRVTGVWQTFIPEPKIGTAQADIGRSAQCAHIEVEKFSGWLGRSKKSV